MASYNYITSTGTILPDTSAVRAEVEQEYLDVLGPDLDTNPSTIQGRLIDLETNARIAVIRNNCTLANQINPDLAEKIFLDAVAKLSGVSRGIAERSTVECTLTGVANTFIPAGTLVGSEDGASEWELTTIVTIPSSGTINAQFRALTPGPTLAAIGTINKIISGTLGLETVTNNVAAIPGKDEANDFELKTDRKIQIATNGNRNALAIVSAVAAVEGVKSTSFRENQTDIPLIIDGKTLVPHSTYIVVDGGLDNEVAQAYYESRSGGSNFNGAVLINVIDEISQQGIVVQFDRPTLRPKELKITIKSISGAQPTDDIITAVISYANSGAFDVGVDVSSFEIATFVSSEVASIFVSNCEIAESGGAFVCGTLETKIFEKATIDSADIEVIYV